MPSKAKAFFGKINSSILKSNENVEHFEQVENLSNITSKTLSSYSQEIFEINSHLTYKEDKICLDELVFESDEVKIKHETGNQAFNEKLFESFEESKQIEMTQILSSFPLQIFETSKLIEVRPIISSSPELLNQTLKKIRMILTIYLTKTITQLNLKLKKKAIKHKKHPFLKSSKRVLQIIFFA